MSGATLIEASVGGPAAAADRRRPGAHGAAAWAGSVFARARMGRAADVRARTRLVRAAGAAGRHRARDDRSCRAIRPTSISPPASSRAARSPHGRTIVEATLDPGSSTEVWWSMRDSAPAAAAREVADARRRDDAPDARRLRRADGGADRRHRRAGRAADARGPAAARLRADEHFGRLARIERSARRRRRADGRRSGGAPPSVPGQPRAPARRRIVHAGHRVS